MICTLFGSISVNGSMMNRQPIPAGNIPTATVKVVRLICLCLVLLDLVP